MSMQGIAHGIDAEQRSCNHRAVILGASGGIGKALALELARRNAELTLFGRSQEKLDALLREVEVLHVYSQGTAEPQAHVKAFSEVFDPDDMRLQGFLDGRLKTELINADIYIHALGPFLQKPIASTSLEDWNATLFYNLKFPALCASLAAGIMAERREASRRPADTAGRAQGVIVLFGGTKTDTVRGFKTNAAYASAKTGLAVFAKSLAREYAGKGVSVIMICPGIVETEYMTGEQKQAWTKLTATGKLSSAGETARAVCDIALAPDIALLSGSVITLDEGLVL